MTNLLGHLIFISEMVLLVVLSIILAGVVNGSGFVTYNLTVDKSISKTTPLPVPLTVGSRFKLSGVYQADPGAHDDLSRFDIFNDQLASRTRTFILQYRFNYSKSPLVIDGDEEVLDYLAVTNILDLSLIHI